MKKILILALLFFLSACAVKKDSFKQSKSIYLTAKFANGFRLSEAGFLYENERYKILELYKLGQGIFKLNLARQICVNELCYSKENFNKTFFKMSHYEDFLQDILDKKPIYKALNLKKTSCGFTQKIKNLNYELCGNTLTYVDKKNNILLRINGL